MMEIVGEFEYSKKDLIGHGAFAVVFKGRTRKNHDKAVAIKSITKKNIAKSQSLLSKEIKILKELSDLHHDHVVQLMECKETTNHVYLVMEYCNGGDLADYLQAKGTLSEDTISLFLKQIAGAMRALNAKGIVHRDMKPQNILLCFPPGMKNPPASHIILKIADFGFARFLQDGVMAATLCGSPMYMAPEVIMSLQYDAKADLWSIGTIVFQCLTGKAPFQAQTPQQLKQFYEKTAELKPNIPSGTSPDLRDLLLKLLKRNARDRIAFEEFFKHPFLQSQSPAASSSPVPVPGRCPSSSSDSPASLKAVSASPLSGKMEYSPSPPPAHTPNIKSKSPRKYDRREPSSQPAGSPHEAADFIKELCDRNHFSSLFEIFSSRRGLRCKSQDFVMVPEGLGSDQFEDEKAIKMSVEDNTIPDNTVTVTPSSGAVIYRKDSNSALNANRPSTLPVTSPDKSPPPSQSSPIPVPTQVAAYRRMQCNSPHSPVASPTVSRAKQPEVSTVAKKESEKKSTSTLHRTSSEVRDVPLNVGDLSPPVQFTIGTPPTNTGVAGTWRRGSLSSSPGKYGTTPPSPLKKSGSVPAHLSPVQYHSPGSLPPIMDSPVKTPSTISFPVNLNEMRGMTINNNSYLRHHPYTVPENLQAVEYNGNIIQQSGADTASRLSTEGTSMLSQQLFKAAFGDNSQDGRSMIPFSGGRERKSSSGNEKVGSLERDRSSSGLLRGRVSHETSPPPSLMHAQSPSNMEGNFMFVAPELSEDTLMDDNHNFIMAKLNFVLDLVECMLEVSRTRGGPLTGNLDGSPKGDGPLANHLRKYPDDQRQLEQLILHVRSLHLLSSSLQLARDEIKSGRLTSSGSLKGVVRQMTEHYHLCVSVSRHFQQKLGPSIQTILTPQIVIATADRLIYNYAIEMCQTAALDELFGNPQECFRRYQTAQIILHSLSQQSRNSRDKESLNKYREAVERRLSNLQGQTYFHNQHYLTS